MLLCKHFIILGGIILYLVAVHNFPACYTDKFTIKGNNNVIEFSCVVIHKSMFILALLYQIDYDSLLYLYQFFVRFATCQGFFEIEGNF